MTLNRQDVEKWAKNALIFAAPALLVLIASTIDAIPKDWQYGAVALYLLNLAADILRKYIGGK